MHSTFLAQSFKDLIHLIAFYKICYIEILVRTVSTKVNLKTMCTKNIVFYTDCVILTSHFLKSMGGKVKLSCGDGIIKGEVSSFSTIILKIVYACPPY